MELIFGLAKKKSYFNISRCIRAYLLASELKILSWKERKKLICRPANMKNKLKANIKKIYFLKEFHAWGK